MVFDLRTVLQAVALAITLLAAVVLAADAFPRVSLFLSLAFRRFGGLGVGMLKLGLPASEKIVERLDPEVEAALDPATRGVPFSVWTLTPDDEGFDSITEFIRYYIAGLLALHDNAPNVNQLLGSITEVWHVRARQGVNVAGDLHVSDRIVIRIVRPTGTVKYQDLGFGIEHLSRVVTEQELRTLTRWSIWLLSVAAAIQILSLAL